VSRYPKGKTNRDFTEARNSELQWHILHTHTHTHPFNSPFSGTTRVSRYQKGKTNLDFTEASDREWQWHQLGHMKVCNSLKTHKHASTPSLAFFTGWMPFLPPNQQHQSTEGTHTHTEILRISCTSSLQLLLCQKKHLFNDPFSRIT